jgi:hypothetical protein
MNTQRFAPFTIAQRAPVTETGTIVDVTVAVTVYEAHAGTLLCGSGSFLDLICVPAVAVAVLVTVVVTGG